MSRDVVFALVKQQLDEARAQVKANLRALIYVCETRGGHRFGADGECEDCHLAHRDANPMEWLGAAAREESPR